MTLSPSHNFLLPTVLVLVTILLVFGMKYMSGARQARLRLAGDDTFRRMAESLTAATTELADVKLRLGSIEKMLRDVG